MASFNVKSTVISNRDAVPKVLTDAFVSGGEMIESEGYVQSGSATDAVGSTYRLCQVPSNARVSSLVLQSDALGGSAAMDVGVYWPTFIPRGAGLDAIVPSAVIDADFFASAVVCSSAVPPTEIVAESGVNTIAKQEMPLWQAIGLSADPMIDLDIVATVTTILAAQGYVSLKAKYVKQ